MNKFKITYPVTTSIDIEKSKFITELHSLSDEKEIKTHLNLARKQHPKANHHCYAYILIDEDNQLVCNQSDDGEPSKTAGFPMLEQLRHADLVNTLAIVIRYFGGTLLGTGGLIRAYSQSVKHALTLATLSPIQLLPGYSVVFDYSLIKQIDHLIINHAAKMDKSSFDFQITYHIYTQDIELIESIKRVSHNKAVVTSLPDKWL